ncbi:MAG: glycoside hydrolase family 5 protein [Candidatus Omnitrophica bacterium]|nr:glycoside hydrolase family 5 protein [Candidatus Omnitrophota bacterium]
MPRRVLNVHKSSKDVTARSTSEYPNQGAQFLSVYRSRIVLDGSPVRLKGVNLGGWLMPEGYILHAPNRAHSLFRKDFVRGLGEAAYAGLEKAFRDNFITEADIDRMRTFGFNCLRVPFHHRLVEARPFQYSRAGVGYLDRVMAWAGRRGIRVILDMHAAPGAQNHDWHSDAEGGRMRFWSGKANQRRAIALWEFLADRYKDEPAVAGYDILNEPVLEDAAPLNRYYRAAIRAVRSIDRNHIIFIEGNRWAQDLACLDDFADENLALSMHFYEPFEFAFNLEPHWRYPLVNKSGRWDRGFMLRRLETLKAEADRRGRPLWCGEFGVNARDGAAGEDRWLKDILAHFGALDIHWTYWTWKAVKHYMFPDGIFSYYPNSPWVNRAGPDYGWETWKRHWPARKKDMIASWRLDKFDLNRKIAEVLHEKV